MSGDRYETDPSATQSLSDGRQERWVGDDGDPADDQCDRHHDADAPSMGHHLLGEHQRGDGTHGGDIHHPRRDEDEEQQQPMQ